jgi:hypothetical protein
MVPSHRDQFDPQEKDELDLRVQLNLTPLEWPLSVRWGLFAAELRTIRDAAMFIMRLPKQYDGQLHWTSAGATLEAAGRYPENSNLLRTATLAMENALATDQMLLR